MISEREAEGIEWSKKNVIVNNLEMEMETVNVNVKTKLMEMTHTLHRIAFPFRFVYNSS